MIYWYQVQAQGEFAVVDFGDHMAVADVGYELRRGPTEVYLKADPRGGLHHLTQKRAPWGYDHVVVVWAAGRSCFVQPEGWGTAHGLFDFALVRHPPGLPTETPKVWAKGLDLVLTGKTGLYDGFSFNCRLDFPFWCKEPPVPTCYDLLGLAWCTEGNGLDKRDHD